MPRQARLIVPDIAVHIVQRGHDRRDCFRHETDYLVYLSTLRELLPKAGCALHAYCLMTNHVHLLLTPATGTACALLMRNLGQRYVQYFNRRYERSGTLWEGRFRSCLVDSARYVLACYRYVERNPVRAGMVGSAVAYRWSSHGGNTGELSNALLTPHAEYLALGQEDAVRLTAYQGLFATEDAPEFLAAIRDATNGGFAVVENAFKSGSPPETQRRLVRQQPGPGAPPLPEQIDILAELGLGPRIS
jgi:putative transposase